MENEEDKFTTTLEDMMDGIERRRKTIRYKIMWPYHRFIRLMDDALSGLKWWIQKKRRGYSDPEMWSLGDHVIRYAYPILKAWREKGPIGYPCGTSPEEWDEILRKIEYAFEIHIKDEECELDYGSEECRQQIDDMHGGLALFGKWLPALWD